MPEPQTIRVDGAPVPWGVAKLSKTGASFIPDRQAHQADHFRVAWRKLEQAFIVKGIPIALKCEFVVERPKAHYGTGRNAWTLKHGAPAAPPGRPDLSNLVKLVEDALTGTAWADDDQVVRIMATKRYARDTREPPHTIVTVGWNPYA